MHFDNGHVQESFSNVGIHVKGQGSRVDQKKGWSIKFNEFVKGQKLMGIEKYINSVFCYFVFKSR